MPAKAAATDPPVRVGTRVRFWVDQHTNHPPTNQREGTVITATEDRVVIEFRTPVLWRARRCHRHITQIEILSACDELIDRSKGSR